MIGELPPDPVTHAPAQVCEHAGGDEQQQYQDSGNRSRIGMKRMHGRETSQIRARGNRQKF
jgi:hypothetical protein